MRCPCVHDLPSLWQDPQVQPGPSLELGAEREQGGRSGRLESFSEADHWGSVQVKAPSRLTLFGTARAVPRVDTDQHIGPCTGHWALAGAPPSWACPSGVGVVGAGDTEWAETTPPDPVS